MLRRRSRAPSHPRRGWNLGELVLSVPVGRFGLGGSRENSTHPWQQPIISPKIAPGRLLHQTCSTCCCRRLLLLPGIPAPPRQVRREAGGRAGAGRVARGGPRERRPAMGSMGLQVLGIALSVVGWLGAILCCGLPMWRVTAFIGNNIVVAQIIWEGLWMNCVVQSTGQMQCKVYESMLALAQDMQAARALVVIAILLAVVGLFFAVLGGKCTNCVEDEATKAKVVVAAGVAFLLAGVLLLIPLCWTANNVIRDFYNPMVVESQKREFGASLYIGWASCGLLFLGGALLCCNCPPRDEKPYSAKYTAAGRSGAASNYV